MEVELDEAISSSTISKAEADKPYHIVKKSKDTLGTYVHHHASFDDYDKASDELIKQKSREKHSFSGYKLVNNKQLKPLVKIKESIDMNENTRALIDSIIGGNTLASGKAMNVALFGKIAEKIDARRKVISKSMFKESVDLDEALSDEQKAAIRKGQGQARSLNKGKLASEKIAKPGTSEDISSGKVQHDLSGKTEEDNHASLMKKDHGVTTKFHKSGEGDELSYHGTKSQVKSALIAHYGDKDEAKEIHPKIFKESVESIVEDSYVAGHVDTYSGHKDSGTHDFKVKFADHPSKDDIAKQNPHLKDHQVNAIHKHINAHCDDNMSGTSSEQDAGGATHEIVIKTDKKLVRANSK